MDIHELKVRDPKRFEKEYWDWCSIVYFEPDIEWLQDEGRKYGFDIEHIHYTLGYSQGDGASWEGRVDLKAFMETHGYSGTPVGVVFDALITDGYMDGHAPIMCGGRSNYMYSEECNTHTWGIEEAITYGALRGANVREMYESVGGDSALDELIDEAVQAARDYAGDIYRAVRDDYEHETSEEAFIENCECNGVEFDEEDFATV